MITLITGTPGAGKTLLAVSTVAKEFLGQTLVTEDGNAYPRRLLVDGIKNLVVEHEPMAATAVRETEVSCEGQGVGNWYEWVKPGDVLLVDEVQRMWRPRGLGTRVPPMIAELETHRHKGVDFVIITQHPMLIDQNVRRLIGRHIHVRRMWGGSRAVRYEWDYCSSPDRVSDAGKSYWPYPKDAYKLYKSAEIHTKQGGRVPFALYALALSAFALPVVGYFAVSKTQTMLHHPAEPIAQQLRHGPATASVSPVATSSPGRTGEVGVVGEVGNSAESKLARLVRPVLNGCISMHGRCECFDHTGAKVDVSADVCEGALSTVGVIVPGPDASPSPAPHLKADAPPKPGAAAI